MTYAAVDARALPRSPGQVAPGLLGTFGHADAAATLCGLGTPPAWHDGATAFKGASVWADATNSLVLSGELQLDNAGDLRRQLALPEAEPLALLAELYRRYGVQAGAHAQGMFAVAIRDVPRRGLVLMRDSIGARTLYYARHAHIWWFAAHLSTLRHCPGLNATLSPAALRDYLTYAFVPGAQTLWEGIYELRPGTALTLPSGKIDNYWEPVEGRWDPAEPLEAHATRLRPLLEDAVTVRLPPAGPVGVYLSGGIDSSLVTALAARRAAGPVHTYSIHFGPEHPHELAYSQLVADHCQTRHHVLGLSARDIETWLPATMRALDDPIGDPLTVPNLLLGRLAAQDVGVILNGEGGDPCFGGPKNQPMVLNELYHPGENRESAYLRSYQKCYDDLPRLLAPPVQSGLRSAPPQTTLLAPFFANPDMPSFLNQLMHINIRLKGADHILTKVSNLTAANGLLGRSPLFDRRLVAASFDIPPAFKLAGKEEKVVLKRAVADLLPPAILARPKSGMLVPVQSWFKRELRHYARRLLLSRDARLRPYIKQRCISDWLAYRGELWPRHGVKLWLLLTLEVWLRVQEE